MEKIETADLFAHYEILSRDTDNKLFLSLEILKKRCKKPFFKTLIDFENLGTSYFAEEASTRFDDKYPKNETAFNIQNQVNELYNKVLANCVNYLLDNIVK